MTDDELVIASARAEHLAQVAASWAEAVDKGAAKVERAQAEVAGAEDALEQTRARAAAVAAERDEAVAVVDAELATRAETEQAPTADSDSGSNAAGGAAAHNASVVISERN